MRGHRTTLLLVVLQAASRGAGTFYSVVDPATKQIAKTKPAD